MEERKWDGSVHVREVTDLVLREALEKLRAQRDVTDPATENKEVAIAPIEDDMDGMKVVRFSDRAYLVMPNGEFRWIP